MNHSLFLTLVVFCGVSVVYSQDVNSTWGHCLNVAHQHNVDLDQVSGIWYFQGIVVPSHMAGSQVGILCMAYRLTRTPAGVLMEARTERPGLPAKTDEWPYVIEDSDSTSDVRIFTWESDVGRESVRMTVLGRSRDNTTLVLALCARTTSPASSYAVVVVISRDLKVNSTEIDAIRDRLQLTLPNIAIVRNKNTTVCEEVDSTIWPIVYEEDLMSA